MCLVKGRKPMLNLICLTSFFRAHDEMQMAAIVSFHYANNSVDIHVHVPKWLVHVAVGDYEPRSTCTCAGRVCCLISPIHVHVCAIIAAIELYTPQGAEMVSGMIYEPYDQGPIS